MRILEILLLTTLLPGALLPLLPRSRRPAWGRYLPWLGLVWLVLHLLLEGYRWQMVPAYALTALLCLLGLRARHALLAAAPDRRWYHALPRFLGALTMLAVLAASALLAWGLPVFEPPTPTGAYAVGTTTLHLVDASRPETFTDAPDDRRELMLEIWYPAEPPPEGASPEPFWGSDPRRRKVAQALRLPGFTFDHLARVATHSYAGARLANGALHPVLIFSHGYAQGFTANNTVLMEELASHGYIVFSIGHPYEGSAVLFPDGRLAEPNLAQIEKVLSERGSPGVLEKVRAAAPGAERRALVKEVIARAQSLTRSVHLWTADTRFVLDELEKLNAAGSGSPFSQRLDLGRLGVLGMSFGGTTAGQVCLDEPRVKAGVNLDGTQFGDLMERPLKKPFLFMNNPGLADVQRTIYELGEGPAWFVVVNGAQHVDFTDLPLILPLFRLLGFVGKVPGERMAQITNAYTLAFFDHFLKGKPAPLLSGPSADYPEVEIESRRAVP